MKVRILQIILGALLYFIATPAGMAKETIPEEVRADVLFDEQNLDFQEAVLCLFDEATLTEAESSPEFEGRQEQAKKTKRSQKRPDAKRIITNKCRLVTDLSAKRLSKCAAKHPATQDAQQERRAAIRFLQLASLAC